MNRTNRKNTIRRNRGLTLIDFMIVVTIAGILLSSAVPSWSRAFADKRLVGEAEQIVYQRVKNC